MADTRYWTQLATQQYPPSDLVRQAAEAEQAGFDALNISDHYQPWWEPGEIILQGGSSWAGDDDAAFEGCRAWKATQPQEYYTDDWHDPKAMYEHAESEISDEEFKQAYIISSDPDHHAERVREIEQLGATVVCLQNASGADPHGALAVYGEKVLPALRGARV